MDEEGIWGLLENPSSLYSRPIHFPYFRSQNLNTVVLYDQERLGELRTALSSPEELGCSSEGRPLFFLSSQWQ